MTSRFARTRRTTIVLTTAIALFVASFATAFAYWLSSGTGTGSATSSTLNPPTNVAGVQTPGTGTVTVTWDAPVGGTAPSSYYVTRNDGVSDSAACGTNSASTITTLSCNDLSVPVGDYTYKVVAVYNSWDTTSAPSLSVSVVQSSQTISFSTNPANPTVFGTYTVMASGGGSTNPVTFSSATPAVCGVSNGSVSFLATGTCTINANQPGSTYYSAAPQAQQTFTVGKASQTISFTPPASGVVFGSSPLSASASSGLTVSFTSATTSVCTVSGTTVSYIASGTCTINADQSGDANYNAAPQNQQDISVVRASQTITAFTVPSSGTFNGTGSLSGTASSGLAVTFSSLSTNVCTVSGATVTYVGTGTCMVQADQAGDTNHYSAAPSVQKSFPVNPANQTITWTGPTSGLVGQGATLSATASSGLAVVFTSTTPSTCTTSGTNGTTLTYVGAGNCILHADQGGNANYNAAPTVIDSFTVSKQSQTISFTSTNPSPVTFGASSYTVTATATSGLTVSFSIDAGSTAGACTIAGNVVSFTGAGTCVIDADQGGNTTYSAAPQVQQSVIINKANQTVSFTSTNPTPVTFGASSYTVTATATSGLAVVFTIDGTSTAGACSLSGSAVSFTGAGTCIIDANQPGNANYNAAGQKQQSITINPANQTITPSTNPTPVGAGTTYTPTATATSGLTVAITIDSTTTTVCSIGGGVVTFNTVGTCKVDFNQAGNANYNAAPQVQQAITVNKGSQTITFTSANPTPAPAGTTYTPTATSTSGLTVAITLDGTSSGCTLSGGVVTFNTIGATCKVDANQAGNTNYNAASQVQQAITITKFNQTISFTSSNPTPRGGGAKYTPTATATSGLAVTFSVSGQCTIAGSVVTFTTAGSCTISADQAGNATYSAAPTVTQVVTVNAPPTVSSPTSASPCNPGHNGTANCSIVGSGFVNGITVTGTGSATVNSVTFNSATSLTINVTGSGGTSAKGNLTFTNPDGGTVTVTNGFSNG